MLDRLDVPFPALRSVTTRICSSLLGIKLNLENKILCDFKSSKICLNKEIFHLKKEITQYCIMGSKNFLKNDKKKS